jgi:hypothetical protein
VKILAYAAVHDCGTLVNPRSLAGQIVGGTAQGNSCWSARPEVGFAACGTPRAAVASCGP